MRWGILGTGRIVHRVMPSFIAAGQQVVAIASRSQQRATQAAQALGIPRAYDSVDALLQNEQLDAVYVVGSHNLHEQNACKALNAGLPVLCEKPLSMDAASARRMIDCARQNNTLLMQAMWTRCLPAVRTALGWIEQGLIGQVTHLQVGFGGPLEEDPTGRMLTPELGGGCLLDVGCYTVALAGWVLGLQPETVQARAAYGPSGVDVDMDITLGYAAGGVAALACSFSRPLQDDAVITGTLGSIELPGFWHANTAILHTADGQTATFHTTMAAEGFEYEILEFVRALQAGEKQSPLLPLDQTLQAMQLLDRIRQACR